MQASAVVGVDIGAHSFKVCLFEGGKFEVLTNEANFRETPSLVGWRKGQRVVGQQAANTYKSNHNNTVRAPMRLIGLGSEEKLIEEEFKHTSLKYDFDEELALLLTGRNGSQEVLVAEQLLISLLSGVVKILNSRGVSGARVFLTVPSFLSHFERNIIRHCGAISGLGELSLVEDWVALATEYSSTRREELAHEERVVVFVDIGYSKTSMFVVGFGRDGCQLFDVEHMRFLGSRNINQLLVEYYDTHITKQNLPSVFGHPKALIKLIDQVDQQRKVLSANAEHSLSIQALINDEDFSHNMNRQWFQNIIEPVTRLISNTFHSLNSRVPKQISVHSVELVGGTTRTPIIKKLIEDVFRVKPSSTLNQSQALVHGTTLYGASESKLGFLPYSIPNPNLIDIVACWNTTSDENYHGQDHTKYKNRKIIFPTNIQCPASEILQFGYEGPVEMFVHYSQVTSSQSIAYLRFQTPNRIQLTLDSSKIVSVSAERKTFDVIKLLDKKQDHWRKLQQWNNDQEASQRRLKVVLELKDQFERNLYNFKEKADEYAPVMSKEEKASISKQLSDIEEWIERENTRSLGSEQDERLYRHRIEEILQYMHPFEVLKQRKEKGGRLNERYLSLIAKIEQVKPKAKNVAQSTKLELLLSWAKEMHQRMTDTQWEGYYLTDSSIEEGLKEVDKILQMS